MKIIVKDDAFFNYADGNLFGTIYLAWDQSAFPCVGWTDFTEGILTMWANELLKCNDKHFSHLTLYFMDGDYWLDVCKDSHMQLDVRCMDTHRCVQEFMCGYFDFLSVLRDGMQSFTSLLDQKQEEITDHDFSGTIRCIEQFITQIEHIISTR